MRHFPPVGKRVPPIFEKIPLMYVLYRVPGHGFYIGSAPVAPAAPKPHRGLVDQPVLAEDPFRSMILSSFLVCDRITLVEPQLGQLRPRLVQCAGRYHDSFGIASDRLALLNRERRGAANKANGSGLRSAQGRPPASTLTCCASGPGLRLHPAPGCQDWSIGGRVAGESGKKSQGSVARAQRERTRPSPASSSS